MTNSITEIITIN